MRGAADAGEPLDESLFARSVHDVARDLIGCSLRFRGVGGVIVEVESYHADDPACHAYIGRTDETPSCSVGRASPTCISYGIHSLLKAV